MSEYHKVKIGKLKLKGEKSHKKHKSKKRKADDEEKSSSKISEFDADRSKHGGWWATSTLEEIRGAVAIQLGSVPMYVRALDNGLFTAGDLHDQGDGPSPEEVLMAIPAGDGSLAFKSGYDKYLGVDAMGRVTGRADAIGAREMWTPVFQDGKLALLASNECFLGRDEDDRITAESSKANTHNMLIIRSNAIRESEKVKEVPEEEQGKLKDVELNYVKKFQKFQDKRIKLNEEGIAELKEAKNAGKLHESLLDRRSKMKADRYCK